MKFKITTKIGEFEVESEIAESVIGLLMEIDYMGFVKINNEKLINGDLVEIIEKI